MSKLVENKVKDTGILVVDLNSCLPNIKIFASEAIYELD